MATSAELLAQLSGMKEMPNYGQVIADAYREPVLNPVVNEGANLEAQWLPTIFDTFAKMGTGAGEMSPAAKLQMIGANLGRLGGRIGANQNVQNYLGAQIQDLAGLEAQRYNQRRGDLQNMYNAQYQREQDAAARALQERQMAMQERELASRMQPAKSSGGLAALLSGKSGGGSLASLLSGGQPGGMGGQVSGMSGMGPSIELGVAQNLQEMNAQRALSGLKPVDQSYFDKYSPYGSIFQQRETPTKYSNTIFPAFGDTVKSAFGKGGSIGSKAKAVLSAPGMPLLWGASKLLGR